jgi:Flp pilus assembly protein TadG
MRGFFSLLNRFRADERGVFAVIFGLMALVLVAMAGAAVDYTSMETARNKMQIALDSAALGLAPKIYSQTEEQLRKSAEDLVLERLNDDRFAISVDSADATTATGTLQLNGTITVPMAFVQLVGIPSMTTSITSEATRGSVNLEVAVALDTTGSMGTTGIETLQTALATLIPLVVHDQQTPTYSKMALVPYSTAVNVSTAYATEARGTVATPTSISAATWKNGAVKNISSITKANPAVVTTSTAHGFVTGEFVYITGVGGMGQINNKKYKVVVTSTTKFSLQTVAGVAVNSSSYSTASNNSGTVQRCYVATCDIAVTSNGHGLSTGENALFLSVVGMTQLNFDLTQDSGSNKYNKPWFVITKLSDNIFTLDGTDGTDSAKGGSYGAYTSGGTVSCVRYGCTYYRYSTSKTVHKATASCAAERMTNSFTDVAPSTTLLSVNYTTNGSCVGNPVKIQPLTASKAKLEAYTVKDALKPSGGTAGQIGTAWAWYLVSPNFAELFDDPVTTVGGDFESKPAAYGAPNTLKIVIIMTDGDYNTEYCKGVETPDYASCKAPDGTTGSMSGAKGQAEDLCYNIKEEKVVVYTVGFNLGTTGNAVDLLKNCASDPDKAKLANNNADLIKAFREIGENISDLRLSM